MRSSFSQFFVIVCGGFLAAGVASCNEGGEAPSNTISACPLNADGSLGVCTVSTLATGSGGPAAIWVQ